MSKRKSKVQEPIQQIGAWEHALPYLDGTYWIRSFASASLEFDTFLTWTFLFPEELGEAR